MKKLLAILLSVLMLCTMIPFATVSAAEGINIIVETDPVEAEAGDEIALTVILENNPGVIGVGVSILFDTDAFELAGEWDGGAFWPDVTMNTRKWKAAGVTYGPDDTKLTVNYVLGTASEVTEETYFTAYFTVKEGAYTGDYEFVVEYNPNNIFNADFKNITVLDVVNGSVHIEGQEPPACVHEYEYDCSTVCSLCGEESRPEAEHQYFYACDPVCMICYEETNPKAAHSIIHVEAKEAVSCIEFGNKEYWYCEHCGSAWLDEDLIRLTNMKAVMTSGPCVSDAEYACQDGVCINCGLPCAAEAEHEYNYACDQYCLNCGELTNEEAAHNIIHVEAAAPTCTENGNIEYWYCDTCDSCWDNANGEGIPLNKMMVIVPALGHVYDDYTDLECNVCGYIREAITPIVVLGNLGAAVSPDVNGLGFGFSANVVDVMVENGNEFIAGAVIPFDDGEIYNLAGVGAILSNDANVELVMENVDDSRTKNVPALLLSDANTEDGQIQFAVRVVNIPNMVKNAAISARPYFIYTTIAGEEIIVYGDVISCSYNEALELASIG